jgi:hypothetical protein
MVQAVYGIVDTVKEQVLLKIPKSSKKIEPRLNSLNSELLNKIPSKDQIENQICNNSDIEDAKLKFNQYKSQAERLQKTIDGLNRNLSNIESKIESVNNLLKTLSNLMEILSKIIIALEIAVVGIKAAIFALAVPVITGGGVKTLSDGIDLVDNNIKKYGLIIKSIPPILNFILPKLDNIRLQVEGYRSLINNNTDFLLDLDMNLNICLKDRLVDEFKGVDDSNRIEDVSNMTLESLVKLSNNNKGVKIEEFKYLGEGKNIMYNVKTIPQKDLKI